MEEQIDQYIKETKTFSIPQLQKELSLSYIDIRQYLSKLEKEGDIELQPDGLTYCLKTYKDEEDFDIYKEIEKAKKCLESIKKKQEDENFWKDTLPVFEERRKGLVKKREKLEREWKILEECQELLDGAKKEYVWVLWHCIKENKIDLFSIQKELLLPLHTIIKAMDWMKKNHYISMDEFPKVLINEELFLLFHGEVEPYKKPNTLLDLEFDLENLEDSKIEVINQANFILMNYIEQHKEITFAELLDVIKWAKYNLKNGDLYEFALMKLKEDYAIQDEESFEKFKNNIK